MDSIKDVFSSLIGSIRERLGNPLIGAFILAWAIWNFRLLIVIFGDSEGGGWREKLDFIDKKLMVPDTAWLIHGLLIPLAIALIWILLLPPALRKIAIVHQRQQVATRTALVAIQDENPMKGIEVANLRARVRKDAERWEDERSQLLKAIDDLRTRVGAYEAREPAADISPVPGDIAPSSATSMPFDTVQLATANAFSLANYFDGDRSVDDRAAMLKLRLGSPVSQPVKVASVTFYGHEIIWPWQMDNVIATAAGLPSGEKAITFDHASIMVLFAIREMDGGTTAATLSLASRFDKFRVQVGFDQLRSLDLVDYAGQKYWINSNGRLFLAWLIRLGFEFEVPRDRTQSSKIDKPS